MHTLEYSGMEGRGSTGGGRTAVSQACGSGPVCLGRGTPRVRPPSPCLQGEKGHSQPLVLWALDSRHCSARESCIVSFYGFFQGLWSPGWKEEALHLIRRDFMTHFLPSQPQRGDAPPSSPFLNPQHPGGPPAYRMKSKQQAREMLK